jgi:hypothetical protein
MSLGRHEQRVLQQIAGAVCSMSGGGSSSGAEQSRDFACQRLKSFQIPGLE